MKKIYLILLFLTAFAISANYSYSQRILINENFETAGFNSDSLPVGWYQVDVDGTGTPGVEWAVRDSGIVYPAGSNFFYRTRAFNSMRSLTIGWRAGDPVADDWCFTDSLRIQTGDSLIFMMTLGSNSTTTYIDTMQVHVCSEQDPLFSVQKLATIRSLDTSNDWVQYKFSLSQFAGQRVYIGFRYWMNTTQDGLLCYIDNVFVGNRSSIGINQINTGIPSKFALNQNYPNPFNPTTKIKFDLAKSTNVKMTVFNSLGQKVLNVFEGFKPAGTYEATFDGSSLASGTYYYKIETDYFTETKKMQLVK
ncbi:MAG: choice-of-anchor J domain-containing protein [Bacteroidetes bacterium]|nr:choice-of-anchor J domain-containing protein [Bacteroidota bacterium]